MNIDPEDADLPVSRRERQLLRTIAARVKARKEAQAAEAAARADAADKATGGPDGYQRGQGSMRPRRRAPSSQATALRRLP